ncbi:MAG: beta-ketoacyl-[acyl-carrier-protein] synthase family protein [Flavobacteriales bacterium]|nr:beta-ketoacyl-[acyl-carrier-protein] synthase family protein [Flavobacteriales bacterium]
MDEFCVTGLGVISAIGLNLKENSESLKKSLTGIAPVEYLGTLHKDFLLGEVKADNDQLREILNLGTDELYDRTTLLGMIAAEEAFKSSGLLSKKNLGLVSSTSVGGMCYTELEFKPYLDMEMYEDFILTHECASSTFHISEKLGIRSYTDTISTACSSSANAILEACKLIKHGVCDRVLAGGTDALSLFTLNGFNTLMILDKEMCRPFDQSRAGLNLGEGAAYLMIEKKSDAIQRNAEIFAYISGGANANDAFHQTASSPEGRGASAAIIKALEMAGLKPEDIQYINAHGTATPNNDLSESTAIQSVFGDHWPDFSSTKGYTGHTLAACGAIEAIYSILMLQDRSLYPCLNFKEPIPEFGKRPLTKLKKTENLRNILSNSFGFGGNCTSIIIQKHEPS